MAQHARLSRLQHWPEIVILGLGLVFCCAFGLITPYLLAIVGIILFVKQLWQRDLVNAYREPTALIFLGAWGLLLVCYAISAKRPGDVVLAFNFVMLLLYAPMRHELTRWARPTNARLVANLASAGVMVALAVALFQIVVLGQPRADNILFGAILLANTAVLLGFLALIGVMTEGPNRWAYLVMPVLGVVVAGLTGSRGPLLAVVPLMLVAAIFIARHFRIRAAVVAGAGIGLVLVGAVAMWAMQSRALTVFTAIGEVLAGRDISAIVDETTRYRLDLYWAGYQAFLQQPIFGHGWARLMSAAWPYLPADKAPYLSLPQLHNDVVNFAVAAGVVGIGVYLTLLAAPVIGVLRSPRDTQFGVRLYGIVILVVAYLFDGLTDLMLGFEFHTAFYATLAAVLLGYCRDRRPQ
jgi:O-antigen ligase